MLQTSAAERLLTDMKTQGVAPNLESYTHVLGSLRRSLDWKRAISFWNELKSTSTSPDQKAYSSMMRTMETTKHWEITLDLLREVRQNFRIPEKIVYDSAISVLHAAKCWPMALTLHDEMRDHDMTPALSSYNAAIHACVKNGDWARGIQYLDHMIQEKILPDTSTCNGALACCDKGSVANHGWKLIKLMRKHKINIVRSTLLHAAGSLRDSTQWEKAWSLVEDMENKAFSPDIRMYNIPIKALTHSIDSEWFRVLDLYRRMSLFAVSPDTNTYSGYLHACAVGGKWARAMHLLNSLVENPTLFNITTTDYNRGIHACLRAKHWNEALKLRELMSALNVQPNLESQAHEIYARGMLHQWEAVLQSVAKLRNEKVAIDVSTYNSIIAALMNSGQVEEAEMILEIMEHPETTQTNASMPVIPPNLYTYENFINGYEMNLCYDRLIKIIYKAIDEGMELDEEGYDKLITAYIETKQWELAIDHFNSMTKNSVVPLAQTFAKLVKLRVEKDQPVAVMEMTNILSNTSLKADADTIKTLWDVCQKDPKWQPILTAVEHLSGDIDDNLVNEKLRNDPAIEYGEDQNTEGEYLRRHSLRSLENPVDEATKIMGGVPLQEEKERTLGTRHLGVSTDPVLQAMQEKKTSLPGVPSNLEQIPLHPDMKLPEKDDPRYAEAVLRSKMAWRDDVRKTVYVGNLQPELTEGQLAEFLSSVGKVVCVAPKRNVEAVTGVTTSTYVQASWFTFVEFETAKGADMSLQLAGYVLGDRQIRIGRANQPIVKSMVPNMALQHLINIGEMPELPDEMGPEVQDEISEGDNDLDESEIIRLMRESIRLMEKDARERNAATKEDKEDVYRELEAQIDVQRQLPKTESMRKRERKEARRRSKSRDREIRRQLEQNLREAARKPPPKPVIKKDPHEGMFFNGWTWIPKDQAQDWIAANQVATLHHLTHSMTPGVASLQSPDQLLPPGIIATVKSENLRAQREAQGETPGFSGNTAFSDEGPVVNLPPEMTGVQQNPGVKT